MKPFILASGSPRRKELLEQVHYSFEIQTSAVDETIEVGLSPAEVVQQLAMRKAKDVFKTATNSVVLGSDTLVVNDDQILGKPSDENEARETLRLLSGRTHHVYTGVAIYSSSDVISFFERTTVEFYPLSDDEIEMYIQSGEPFDKAGSYGIQGLGAYLVKQMTGDYYSVVGLPLAKTMRALKTVGIIPNRTEP